MKESVNVLRSLGSLAKRVTHRLPEVGRTPCDVVHAENKWRLLHYQRGEHPVHYRTPVLLVPSLINRHYVLDLLPERSFAAYLVEQGHDVYVIDWGTPGGEDRHVSFDDICDAALGRAVRRVARRAPGRRIHLLGYCLGGTLTTIYAAAHPEHVATLTGLAAPIRFENDSLLSRWMRTSTLDVAALTEATGNVPWQLMQASFYLLKPTLLARKMIGLLDRAWDDQYLDGFLAIETWGNDNVSFPGAFYRTYVEELYRKDALVNGTFRLSGARVRLQDVRCPVMVVTFGHDYIVPAESAMPLVEQVGSDDVEHIHLPGGHVGAVVSRKGAENLWPQLSEWWAARDAAPGKAGLRAVR